MYRYIENLTIMQEHDVKNMWRKLAYAILYCTNACISFIKLK